VQVVANTLRITRFSFVLFILGVAIAAVVVGVETASSLVGPLHEMASAAGRVMEGDRDAMFLYRRFDEVGTLNRVIYDMAARLNELAEDRSQRESEWTVELTRRMHYLETTGEIASVMTGGVDLPDLFSQTVTSISHRFDYYHVGVFMLNLTGEWAVLQAASSEQGQHMLAQEYRVPVGQEDNPVGYATAWGSSRMVLAHQSAPSARVLSWLSSWSQRGQDDAGLETPVNPDMPETRTELALPLKVRGEVVGALDIHSTKEDAFSEEDVVVLQALADQLAMAASNTRLFQQAQESLEAERRAYGETSRQAWQEMLLAKPDLGFLRNKRGLFPVRDAGSEDDQIVSHEEVAARDAQGAHTLETPITVRGHVIGVIDTHKSGEAGPWTPDEISLLESLADQLGAALEGARLYQDAQRRAVRERLTRDITDKMRRAASIEGVVQAAVDELFEALGTSRAFVRLGTTPDEDGGNGRDPVENTEKEVVSYD
jgi:GAF domain-containing protein